MRSFQNVMEVYQHLQGEGYKVSKSKVYADAKAGILRQSENGNFTVRAVNTYVKVCALQKDGDFGSDDEISSLSTQKLRGQARVAEIDAEIKALELEHRRGKLVSIDDYNSDFARAALILKNSGLQFFESRTKEIIFRCEGDPGSAEALSSWLVEEFRQWLHGFSQKRSYEIAGDECS